MKTSPDRIPFRDALKVKSAELWLQLGQPSEALKELETVSERARQHPWASRVLSEALHKYCATSSPQARS
jgi:hypothetical protein